MAKVVFDLDLFKEQFPSLISASVTEGVLDLMWHTAESFVRNDDSSEIPYDPESKVFTRRMLLYYAMAHLLRLTLNPTGLPGRITSASEGSVNISVESFQANSLNAQWWSQTPEGLLFWQLSAPYRLGTRVFLYRQSHPWG